MIKISDLVESINIYAFVEKYEPFISKVGQVHFSFIINYLQIKKTLNSIYIFIVIFIFFKNGFVPLSKETAHTQVYSLVSSLDKKFRYS